MSFMDNYVESFCRKGHDFKPRYDEKPSDMPGSFDGSPSAVIEAMKMFVERTYVKDVCVKCGKEIAR